MTSPTPRSAAEQDEVELTIRDLFERKITFNQHLGLKVDELGDERVLIRFPMQPQLVGHYLFGRLHGGVISSVLDATGGLAVLWAGTQYFQHETAEQMMARFANFGTVDLRVDFVRQGLGESFQASGEVIRLGRRIGFARMQLENEEGVLLACASANYVVS